VVTRGKTFPSLGKDAATAPTGEVVRIYSCILLFTGRVGCSHLLEEMGWTSCIEE